METLVGDEGNEKGKFKESGVEKINSSISLPKLSAAPVVYKLVQVDRDGRLVPATDDELMEDGNLLAEDKIEILLVSDTGQTETFNCNERSSSGMHQLESSEGLSQSENAEVEVGKSDTFIEYIEEILPKAKQEESHLLACGSPDHSSAYVLVDSQCSDQHYTLPGIDGKIQSEIPLQENNLSSVPSLIKTPVSRSVDVGECSHPLSGVIEGQQSTSFVCSSSKPDFTRLKGEICLDNLSIKELHETFKATFGRETTVKDKQWIKRRIAMGLTNSCDVSMSSFIIKDSKLVSKSKEGRCNNEATTSTKGLVVGPVIGVSEDSSVNHNSHLESQQFAPGEKLRNCSIDHDSRSEDLHKEQRVTKRIRKPTRRYIEELSEVGSKVHCGKATISAKTSGIRPVRIDSCNRTVRLDSLGGSVVQVPYVSRVRRSRPRKNVMALMEFHPYGIIMAATLVKKAFRVHSAQPNSESGDIILKAGSAPEQIQQPLKVE